jgi:hypothetical protein
MSALFERLGAAPRQRPDVERASDAECLRLRATADPALHPMVEDVRRALARVTGEQ